MHSIAISEINQMTIAKHHLRYTHLDQLRDNSKDSRYALQLYIQRAIENRVYFDELVDQNWPLLEYIQTTQPDAPKEIDKYLDTLSDKSLQDIADRVFSRSMADVVVNDLSLPKKRRLALAERLKTCGVVSGYSECPDGHRKLVRFYCDQPKYCRRCARIHAYRNAEHLVNVTHSLLEGPITGYEARLLTLTCRKTGNVTKDAKLVTTSWSKMWRSHFKDRHSAAYRRVEVSPDGMVHLHILLYCQWVDVEEISKEWSELTGGSMVVHIKKVSHKKKGELKKAIYEVCKYVTDMDKWVERHGIEEGLQLVNEIGHALHGKRLSEPYGLYRKAVFEDRMVNSYPIKKEKSPDRCDCCGKKWRAFIEVFEPRGPPQLRVYSRSNSLN